MTGVIVHKMGVEPTRPFGHIDLNDARLPFRHVCVAIQLCHRETFAVELRVATAVTLTCSSGDLNPYALTDTST